MTEQRKPQIGDRFWSKSLELEGFFPDWATPEYIADQRKKYPAIYIEEYIVDWIDKDYEPQGYDLDEIVYNENQQRWEEI